MTADVPHGWDNPDGSRTDGTIPVTLCAVCDVDRPAAGPLVAYLLVHEEITEDNLAEGAALIRRWAESLYIGAADASKIEEELNAWRRGDL
jgi:hypothetical protein